LSRELRSAHAPHRFAQAVVVTCAVVLWCIIGLQPAFGALKMDWDRTFPLTVANEIGDARPWLGKVRYIGIYGRGLLERDVRRLHAGLGSPQVSDVRRACGLLAGYDFRRLATEKLQSQAELRDPNLDLIVPSNCSWSVTDGLTTSRFPIIKSVGNASALTDRIVSSGAFSVEAWIQPDNLRQIGPARLVSISSGLAIRNFTLGQAAADVVFRVRNRVNSSNGTVHELAASNVLSMEVQHIVATYDHGVSMVYRDGNYCSGIDLREPVFYSGFASGPMARGALVALVVITISLPARFLLATILRPSAAVIATVLFTFAAGTLPYLISCLVVGGPFRFVFIGWFAAALLLVFPVGLMLISTEPTLPGENPQNLTAKGAKSASPLVGSL
jgi:hypothetical protein